MRPSSHPPRMPAMMPSRVPTKTESRLEISAIVTEIDRPSHTRDSMSRPEPGSMPSGCCHEAPLKAPWGSVSSPSRSWWNEYGSMMPSLSTIGAVIASTTNPTITQKETIERRSSRKRAKAS